MSWLCQHVLAQLTEMQRQKTAAIDRHDTFVTNFANEEDSDEYENHRIRMNGQKYHIDQLNNDIKHQMELVSKVCHS